MVLQALPQNVSTESGGAAAPVAAAGRAASPGRGPSSLEVEWQQCIRDLQEQGAPPEVVAQAHRVKDLLGIDAALKNYGMLARALRGEHVVHHPDRDNQG